VGLLLFLQVLLRTAKRSSAVIVRPRKLPHLQSLQRKHPPKKALPRKVPLKMLELHELGYHQHTDSDLLALHDIYQEVAGQVPEDLAESLFHRGLVPVELEEQIYT
jgi:hypothetical protein